MSIEPKISVVLVDDSSVIRGVLSRILEADQTIEVVGSVSNGQMGVTMAASKKPNVVILDVEMPVMDGLTALPEILKASPETKVIMCSSLTAQGADTTMKAMALGAVECLVKPSSTQETGPNSPFQRDLINLIKGLGLKPKVSAPVPASVPDGPAVATSTSIYNGKPDILAIGSSTGGPQALFAALKAMGPIDIPVVITQHMPATFTKILAEHICQQTGLTAIEADEGMIVEPGKVYVAQGGKHMLFERDGINLKIKLDDGPMENFCKPAVDPMLRSLIDLYGNRVLFTILTGMGHDGFKGAQLLTEKGGRVIAQDEATSVVWGMPGAVAQAGIASEVLPLDQIGSWLKRACS